MQWSCRGSKKAKRLQQSDLPGIAGERGTSKPKRSFVLTVPESLECRRRPTQKQRRSVGVNAALAAHAQAASTGPPRKARVGRTLSVVASHKRGACLSVRLPPRVTGGRWGAAGQRRRVVLKLVGGSDPPPCRALWLSLLVKGSHGHGARPFGSAGLERASCHRPQATPTPTRSNDSGISVCDPSGTSTRHVAPGTDPTHGRGPFLKTIALLWFSKFPRCHRNKFTLPLPFSVTRS